MPGNRLECLLDLKMVIAAHKEPAQKLTECIVVIVKMTDCFYV